MVRLIQVEKEKAKTSEKEENIVLEEEVVGDAGGAGRGEGEDGAEERRGGGKI